MTRFNAVLIIHVCDSIYYDSCVTVILMVLRTMLILHSSATFYIAYRLLCFLFTFVSLAKPYQLSIQLLISLLCCIGANNVLQVFSVQIMIMFDGFLFGHASLSNYRITGIYMLWFHKNKGHSACFMCVGCLYRVLLCMLVSATCHCTTKGHPVVLSSEKR